MARAAASASAAGENRVGKEPSSTARESDITKKAHCQDMAAEGVRAARSQAHRATRSTARASSGDSKPGVFFCARVQNTMAAAKTSGPSGAPREASSPPRLRKRHHPLPTCAATRENAAAGASSPRLWRGRRTRLPPIPRGDGPHRLPNRRQRAATANAIRDRCCARRRTCARGTAHRRHRRARPNAPPRRQRGGSCSGARSFLRKQRAS